MPAFAGMTMALVFSTSALACKCAMQPLSARLDASDHVVALRIDGLAVDQEQKQSLYSESPFARPMESASHELPVHARSNVTYAVIEQLKGESASVRRLTTGMGGGDCGVPLQVGHDYLLLGSVDDGVLRVTTCAGPIDLGIRSLWSAQDMPPTRESMQLDAARAYLRDKTPIPPCLDDPDGENCEAWFAERGL